MLFLFSGLGSDEASPKVAVQRIAVLWQDSHVTKMSCGNTVPSAKTA
jgi:hypothetical protein